MLKWNNGIQFATVVLLIGIGQAEGQTRNWVSSDDVDQSDVVNRLIPGAELGFPVFPSSLPLIDDVAVQSEFEAVDSPCQLNAPLSAIDNLTSDLPINQCCSGGSCKTCVSASCTTNANSQAKYNRQVASLLAVTLAGSDPNSAAQQRAIETALQMVVEHASVQSDARMKQMELAHQRTMAQMQLILAQRNAESKSETQSTPRLEKVIATQFRNSKQLESLIEVNQSMQRSIGSIESQLASFAMMQRAKLSQPEIRRMMESVHEQEAAELEVEMLQKKLQALNERIRALHDQSVRSAMHLEPVYVPERPLEPITNPNQR